MNSMTKNNFLISPYQLGKYKEVDFLSINELQHYEKHRAQQRQVACHRTRMLFGRFLSDEIPYKQSDMEEEG
jgi:hypothetical protein